MSPSEIRRALDGAFPTVDRKYLRAVELWAEYYLACDAFDGTAGPPPPERRAASSSYARARWRATYSLAAVEKIDDETMERARNIGLDEAERRQRASGFDPEWFAYIDARRAGMMR